MYHKPYSYGKTVQNAFFWVESTQTQVSGRFSNFQPLRQARAQQYLHFLKYKRQFFPSRSNVNRIIIFYFFSSPAITIQTVFPSRKSPNTQTSKVNLLKTMISTRLFNRIHNIMIVFVRNISPIKPQSCLVTSKCMHIKLYENRKKSFKR